MIPFNIEQLQVTHVRLKSCTTALGGSVMIVDEERSTSERESFKKIKVPMAVVRQFVKDNNKIARYMKPVLTAITYYGEHAVAMERHVSGGYDEHGRSLEWFSDSERYLDKYVMPLTLNGEWYVDGTYVYTFTKSDVDSAEKLSGDGRFKSVEVRALKLSDIHDPTKISSTSDRTCLLYTAANGSTAMSPPIWKILGGVGKGMMGQDEEEDGVTTTDAIGVVAGNHQFDRIDELLAVNLSFALKAGKSVAGVFGYDAIEPLGLDDLMIQLRTVNLPRIAKEVKQTFDTGMPFTHGIAWLLGLTSRTETLDSYIVLRSLLKYLTTKGIYRRNTFLPEAVYKKDMNRDSVPALTAEEAHEMTRIKLSLLGATPIGALRKFV